MAIPSTLLDRPSSQAIHRAQDVATPAAAAFARILEVEKWPVWLSFLRSVRRTEPHLAVGLGTEVAMRSQMAGDEEELFEVDRFIPGHHVSLVGAFSCRRRFDVRVEQKSECSKIIVRVDYPTYGGVAAAVLDRLTRRRRLESALAASLLHFKGLVEFDRLGSGALENF